MEVWLRPLVWCVPCALLVMAATVLARPQSRAIPLLVRGGCLCAVLACFVLACWTVLEAPPLDKPRDPVFLRSDALWLAGFEPDLSFVGKSGTSMSTTVEDVSWRLVGPDIRLSFGVDRIAVWPMLGIASLTLLIVWRRTTAPIDGPGLAAVLGLAGCGLLFWVACDVVLQFWSVLGVVALFGLQLMHEGGPDRRKVAPRYWAQSLAGCLAWLLGWLMLAGAIPTLRRLALLKPRAMTFDWAEAAFGAWKLSMRDPESALYWQGLTPYTIGGLAMAAWLWSALPPFHLALTRTVLQASSSSAALWLATLLPIGFVQWRRLILVIFGPECDSAAPWVQAWLVGCGFLLSLVALSQTDVKKSLVNILASLMCLWSSSAWMMSLVTGQAIWQAALPGIWIIALLFWLIGPACEALGSESDAVAEAIATQPRRRLLVMTIILVSWGLLLAGWSGLTIHLATLWARNLGLVLVTAATLAVLAWTSIWLIQQVCFGSRRVSDDSGRPLLVIPATGPMDDVTRLETVLVAGLLALGTLMSVAPAAVLWGRSPRSIPASTDGATRESASIAPEEVRP